MIIQAVSYSMANKMRWGKYCPNNSWINSKCWIWT